MSLFHIRNGIWRNCSEWQLRKEGVFKGTMLTGLAKLFAWMLSSDYMRGAVVVLGGTKHYTRSTATDWAGQSQWLFGRASPTNRVRCVGLESEESTRKIDYVQRTAPSHVAGGCATHARLSLVLHYALRWRWICMSKSSVLVRIAYS